MLFCNYLFTREMKKKLIGKFCLQSSFKNVNSETISKLMGGLFHLQSYLTFLGQTVD